MCRFLGEHFMGLSPGTDVAPQRENPPELKDPLVEFPGGLLAGGQRNPQTTGGLHFQMSKPDTIL